MQKPRSSLAYKLFGAIGLTALAVVGVMAVLIAGSMRDGFTRSPRSIPDSLWVARWNNGKGL